MHKLTKFHPWIKPPWRSYDVISISPDGGHGLKNLILIACIVSAFV